MTSLSSTIWNFNIFRLHTVICIYIGWSLPSKRSEGDEGGRCALPGGDGVQAEEAQEGHAAGQGREASGRLYREGAEQRHKMYLFLEAPFFGKMRVERKLIGNVPILCCYLINCWYCVVIGVAAACDAAAPNVRESSSLLN